MKLAPFIVSIATLATVSTASDVLIVSAGSPTTDAALVAGLVAQGHTASIGPNYWEFDTNFDLSPYDVVYIQGNGNWTQSDMPVDAQTMILDYAQQGAGVVFSEWVVWMVHARGVFQVLAASMPVESTNIYRTTSTLTYTQNTPDPIVNAGLPASFDMPLTSFSGTESFLVPKENATVFYDSDWVRGDVTGAAIVGWDICGGRVVNFSTTNGGSQINDPEFQILLGNLMEWVTRSVQDNSCPADIAAPCGFLNFFDVSAYIARFSAQDLRADLNGDSVLNFLDISQFLSVFSSGCP